MESPKYLIVITLIDGQNFTVPDGILDRVEATVFAEARFGNESILKSDPVKLVNSNPEFVTELAWQLDKKSLHQLRVERKSIKLQIYMQTCEKKRNSRRPSTSRTNDACPPESSATNKIELIGYTVLDIRSAHDGDQPKFKWLPLLNPKFKKPSYNRPEVQLAITLTKIDDTKGHGPNGLTSPTDPIANGLHADTKNHKSDSLESEPTSSLESRLYKTCLDFTINSDIVHNDEILENDIQIVSKGQYFYIFDKSQAERCTIDDCNDHHKITITIPFINGLDSLISNGKAGEYYFTMCLFGASLRTKTFTEISDDNKIQLDFNILTTHSSLVAKYFELNPSFEIKLQHISGKILGIAAIQLDQLCNSSSKRRSIEGLFAMQQIDPDIPSAGQPSIGVSVVLDRKNEATFIKSSVNGDEVPLCTSRQLFEEDLDYIDYLHTTHQLTADTTQPDDLVQHHDSINIDDRSDELTLEDHHFCFTIDLKNFSYTPNQRLIPTLRDLVVRYAYPFFGYKDAITTDASVPISSTNSIIVDGFCQFNFATTTDSLLLALREIPLDLEILSGEQVKRIDSDFKQSEKLVATSCLNLADTMNLNESTMKDLDKSAISRTESTPVYSLDGKEVGQIQVYLCLEDLGRPPMKSKDELSSSENMVNDSPVGRKTNKPAIIDHSLVEKLEKFMSESKDVMSDWKKELKEQIAQDIRGKENEIYKKLYNRFEAKDVKREQEHKRKMDELNNLDKRLKQSLAAIESLQIKLTDNLEQLKTKDAQLDDRLGIIDSTISKAFNDMRSEFAHRSHSMPVRPQRSCENTTSHQANVNTRDHPPAARPINTATTTRVSSAQRQNQIEDNLNHNQSRRSSLKNTQGAPGIPLPVRSSSLVRGPSDGVITRLVKRPSQPATTVINSWTTRRASLSKENQAKLTSLRREKAELLKRGCRPNDDLIQEINSLIEKLAF